MGKLIVISRVLHDMIREVAELPGASTVTLTIANRVSAPRVVRRPGRRARLVCLGGSSSLSSLCVAPSPSVPIPPALQRPHFQLHAMGSLGSVTVALDSKSDALVSLEAQGHFK